MTAFKGFSDSEQLTGLPDTLFRELLTQIQEVTELKVALVALWEIEHMDGPLRGLREMDFDAKQLGLAAEEVHSGLELAQKRGILIRAAHGDQVLYFLNSPRGRASAQAFAQGGMQDADVTFGPQERPNVFKIYEENIGPLTPLIADALRDAEATFSSQWTADAIELAVKNNKRNWKYCEAILKRWKEEGRAEKQTRRDDQATRQRDVEDKIRKFIDG